MKNRNPNKPLSKINNATDVMSPCSYGNSTSTLFEQKASTIRTLQSKFFEKAQKLASISPQKQDSLQIEINEC